MNKSAFTRVTVAVLVCALAIISLTAITAFAETAQTPQVSYAIGTPYKYTAADGVTVLEYGTDSPKASTAIASVSGNKVSLGATKDLQSESKNFKLIYVPVKATVTVPANTEQYIVNHSIEINARRAVELNSATATASAAVYYLGSSDSSSEITFYPYYENAKSKDGTDKKELGMIALGKQNLSSASFGGSFEKTVAYKNSTSTAKKITGYFGVMIIIQSATEYTNTMTGEFTFTAEKAQLLSFESDSKFTLATANGAKNWNGKLEYSVNLNTWKEWDGTEISSSAGGKLYLRGLGNGYLTSGINDPDKCFVLTGSNISCNGDIMALLDYTAPESADMAANAFANLFYNNANLICAPELSAQTLTMYCYRNMFEGCTGLTEAPALPATTLADSCYNEMFKGCTGLTKAPTLSATTLASRCYMNMFRDCTGLTKAPTLPAKALAPSCYNAMFYGCTDLKTAPELPAETLAESCYYAMFEGCTGLTQAPALSAATLEKNCYYNMFYGCEALATAPALSAKVMAAGCYYAMFQGCTALTQAPALSATTLALKCYAFMFKGCTELTEVPTLPATVMAEGCYYAMFQDCIGLTALPSLPAEALEYNCYSYMFDRCTGIKLSAEKTNDYSLEWSIPVSGEVSVNWGADTMLGNTKGTFTGPVQLNTVYYLPAEYHEHAQSGVCDCGAVVINETNFPDAIFREYVKTLDGDGDGVFTENERMEIRSITVSKVSSTPDSERIASLKGIEFFPQITVLSCQYNKLTSLDLSQNTKLVTLNCYANALTELNISANSVLKSLYCQNNPSLAEIDVAGKTKLVHISAYNTALTAVDVTGCTELNTLNVYDNSALESVTFGDNGKLAVLNVKNTNIGEVDLSALPALTTLYAYSCPRLASIDASGHAKLAGLYVYSNDGLVSIDVSGCENLTTLSATQNPKLQSVNLSGVSAIKKLTLYGLPELTSITLGGNTALESISAYSNPKLTSLDLSECTALEDITAQGCNLLSLDFSNLTKLSYIAVGNNPSLAGLKLSGCTALAKLYAYNTAITELDLSDCPSVEILSIAETKLTSLDLTGLTSLNSVYLSETKDLKSLTLGGNTALTTLDVEESGLTALDLSGAPNIVQLFADSCESLESISLENCTALKYLEMRFCRSLQSLDLSPATALVRAYINSCPKLSFVDASGLPELSILKIAGNALVAVNLEGTDNITDFAGNAQYVGIELDQKSMSYELSGLGAQLSPSKLTITDGEATIDGGKLIAVETAYNYQYIDFTYDANGYEISGQFNVKNPHKHIEAKDDDRNCLTALLCSCEKAVIEAKADHTYTYTVSGRVITESCSAEGCTAHTATATISAPQGAPAYDESPHPASVKYSEGWKGATPEIAYTRGGNSTDETVNAGKYTASLTVDGKTASTSYTVYRKAVEIPAADSTAFTYTGAEQTYNIAENPLYKVAGNKKTDAGEYKVTITLADTENHVWSSGRDTAVEYDFVIARASYDMSGITFENAAFTYDGKPHSLVIDGTLPTGADGITVTVSYSGSATDVANGEVTVTATFASTSKNYNIPSAMTAKVKINARSIENASITLGAPLAYTGSVQTQTVAGVTVDGLNVTYDVSGNTATAAGSYELTVTGNGNFTGTAKKAWSMEKAARSAPIGVVGIGTTYIDLDDGKLIGVSPEMEYKPAEQSTYIAIAGDEVEGLASGEYHIRYKADGNHTASAPVVIKIALGGKRAVSISLASTLVLDKTYDGVPVSFDTANCIYSGDGEIKIAWYADKNGVKGEALSAAPTDAGVYYLGISAAETQTYSSTAEIIKKFKIDKATYDMSGITLENGVFTYDGSAHSIAIKGTLPDGVSVTYEENGKTEAGIYTVTAKFEGDSRNYNAIPALTAEITVNKASLDISGITFAGKTAVYDGSAHSLEVIGTLPDGVSVIYDGNGKTEAGIYTVTAKFVYDERNYNAPCDLTATLTVNKSTLTDFIGDESKAPAVIVTDKDGFAPSTEIVITALEAKDSAAYENIGKFDRVGAVYGVELLSNGAAASPEGDITISLLIPNKLANKDFRILQSRADGIEEIEYTKDGGYAVFDTDSLAEFSFVYYEFPWWIILILAAALILGTAAAVIVIRKKK